MQNHKNTKIPPRETTASPVFPSTTIELLWPGWREHLIGTIKQHHCHIDPVLSTRWWGCVCQQFQPFRESCGAEVHHHHPVCVTRPTIFARCLERKYIIFSISTIFSQSRLSDNACWVSQRWAPQQRLRCSWGAFKAESILCCRDSTHISSASITCIWKRNVFYSTLFRAVLVNLFLAKVDFFQWKKNHKEYHNWKC